MLIIVSNIRYTRKMDITYSLILGSYTLYKYIKGRDVLAGGGGEVEGMERRRRRTRTHLLNYMIYLKKIIFIKPITMYNE